ncbi:MAG: endolytic transglycosylase MltG [Nitrospinota bacterium]|nr:endolytic transglycosylase MltG [Nitrospinota bacterium]
MRILKTSLLVGFWGLIILLWVIGGLFYYQAAYPLVEVSEPKRFKVEKGMTLKQVAYRLAESNLIRGPSAFRLLAYIQNKQNQIKAGEFRISASMTAMEILQRITSGQSILYSITIPEGYRITEIASLLSRVGLADRQKFIESAQDPLLIDSLGLTMKNLEGYLFPDTYYFSKNTSEGKIVKSMLDTFMEQTVRPEFRQRAMKIGLTFHEVITLASLIEKETGDRRERKLISAVFHNRLKNKMRLQCDPTVIYTLDNFDGNLRKKDLSIDSPYNTYRYSGLPPGPIASPGLDSIKAALFPALVNHIYFVSKRDGSHVFSSTLADHNRAVRKYQLRGRKSL